MITLGLALVWGGACGVWGEVFYEQRLDPYPLPIILPANFGGQIYPFILDTGSSRNLCDPSLQGLLGTMVARIPASTPGGIVKISFYEPPAISLGRGRISQTPVGLEDFSPLRRATGFNIRGILGAAAFQGIAIWLDYDHHSLKLARNVAPRGMGVMDLEYGADHVSPYLSLNVAGRKVRFCLDLGFNGMVGLSRPMFAKLTSAGIVREFKGQDEVSITMGGKMKNRSGQFVKGDILGLKHAGVSVSNQGDFNMLGVEFLVNYNVIIDLERSKFYFRPRRAEPPINIYGMLGAIVFCEDGCGVVYQLRPGDGPAVDAGLKEGDKLIRLGRLRRGQFNAAALYELGLQYAGRTLDVEFLRRGQPEPILTRLRLAR